MIPSDDALEALPVVIDGVSRPPRDASEGQLIDAPHMPEFGYWHKTTPVSAPPAAKRSPKSFRHMVHFAPGQLDALHDWWERRANCGCVKVRGLTLYEPEGSAHTWMLRADLHRPGARPLRMELALWRCMGDWTRVTLDPQRSVLATPMYFRAGHRVLDALCEQLAQEL